MIKSIAILASHCDDIAISIGATVASCNMKIDGYIFFSKSCYTLNGHFDQKYVTKIRMIEEKRAANILGYKPVFLNLPDDSINRTLCNSVIEKVIRNVTNKKYSLLFVPLGIGYHNDHILLNKLFNELLVCGNISEVPNIIFYEDLPYAAEETVNISSIRKELLNNGFVQITSGQGHWSCKEKALMEYKTQIDNRIIKIIKREYMMKNGESLWINKGHQLINPESGLCVY